MQRSTERPYSRRKFVTRGARARLKPLARVIAILAAGGVAGQAQAQQAFSQAWFANKGAVQSAAAATGRLPNGQPVSPGQNPLLQQQQAREQLQHSFNNLNLAARAIAAQQSAQAAARAAALASGSSVPDGLVEGGLKVDTNSLSAGWLNAKAPTQSVADGKTTVTIEQTADKAILNWETFNVGKNTKVSFDQQASWSVLNRVNDPLARPSQIQGQIEAPGTVLIVNRNGIVFDGSSQVNVRNLAAAAVGMSDAQFRQGLYSEAQGSGYVPTFANDLDRTASGFSHGDASGDVIVEQGALISTHKPGSVTEGGGYVLLLGRDAKNAGRIVTESGQTVLAAGDAFVIRKGMGTDSNQTSTTRGNEVSALTNNGSAAGRATNTGLIQASTGDITLTGRQVRQQGVAVATTSVNTRGTVHLNGLSTAFDSVSLDKNSLTAILLDDTSATALDAQRDALIKDSDKSGDRRDQSLIQISSGGGVSFAADSLTLATGGQVLVDAAGRSELADGAQIDVSGAFGVRVAMESNNVLINVQGNEQRDAPVNRDGDGLRNNDIWVDRRDLVLVPAGTNGYATDRWYTAGGLLEVSGYLGTSGHSIGEWMALGGTVQFGGGELVTQAGSIINLSGGTLDVQTGKIRQTWLKGADGRLYVASTAPGDLLYTGLYRGFETQHARWGDSAVESFYNPLIAPRERLENGYTVGRDAGRLIVATQGAVLQGQIDSSVYQGPQQTRGRDAGLDGYLQAQTAVARRGGLVIGTYTPVYDKDTGNLKYSPAAVVEKVTIGDLAQAVVEQNHIQLDAGWLNQQELGALKVYAKGGLEVNESLALAQGGELALHATEVNINADLTARGGGIAVGNLVEKWTGSGTGWMTGRLASVAPAGYTARTVIDDGVTLDARGIWSNLQLDGADIGGLPFVDGGNIDLRSSGDVVVGAGAVLDVSSGAALRADDSLEGGKGGNITLIANGDPAGADSGHGRLLLKGELRSHGVKGGGTLRLQTGDAVVIGGQIAGSDGTLRAGEASLVDLVTEGGFTIDAGAILPVDYHYTRTHAEPGDMIGSAPLVDLNRPETWLTLNAPWAPPKPSDGSYTIWTSTGQQVTVYSWSSPPELPAGTVITAITNASVFPSGHIVSADVFPDGIAIAPSPGVLKAGTVAPTDVTFGAGTVIAAGTRLPQTVAVGPVLHLDAERFQQGFSRYEIIGGNGLAVAENANLDVRMPVLRLEPGTARGVATGADPLAALSLWQPPVFAENAAKGALSQRRGADLVLTAGLAGSGTAPALTIGRGASVNVDPGRGITLLGDGQTTVEGELHAAGGRINLLGLGYRDADIGSARGHDGSIWIGEGAVLDVAGVAATALDAQGRRYGRVLDGGRIQIGGEYKADATVADAVDRFIVVRPGARLDASGAATVLDLPQGATPVAANGGLIYLSSFNGLYLDGDLRAAAGGAGAAGGTLALTLETPNYANSDNPDARVRVHRELLLMKQQSAEALAADLRPGEADPALVYGHARIGADRVTAGGFDNLALLVNGVLSLEDGLDLSLGQSLRLTSRSLGLPEGAADGAGVRLAAPYVRLAGATRSQKDHYIMPYPGISPAGLDGIVSLVTGSRLRVESSLLDVIDSVTFGTYGYLQQVSGPERIARPGFETVELRSQGDMRFLASSRGTLAKTSLETVGDLVLAASQLYPATGAAVDVSAGRMGYINQWGSFSVDFDPSRSLRIERSSPNGAAAPRVPFSVFGSIQLLSANVDQGGVVRAPLGTIVVGTGEAFSDTHATALLRPGSVTSVSAAGLTMPYGGTVDGLTYLYNGIDVPYYGLGGQLGNVRLAADDIEAQAGAVIDLAGGGDLTGAAFLSGRGGSTDARLNPLVQVSAGNGGFVLPGLATNPVYAIVPGVQPGYAPMAAEKGAGDPVIGRQITIGGGVPGLPAGTYTLLPSTYALLPGAFRVELNGLASSVVAAGETSPMRNGSYSTSAQLSIANTGIRDALPSQVILTSADTLRAYSQYNETSYAQFGLNWAARDSVPRPQLERDARLLSLAPVQRLDLAENVVNFAAAKGGRGGTVVLKGSRIEIIADTAAPTAGFDGLSIRAGVLNDIGASTISIGGTPSSSFSSIGYGSTQNAWQVGFGSAYDTATEITLREGAVLSAAQVFLVTGRDKEGGITVEQGAGIDTLGRGKAAWDSTEGYVIAPGESGVLALSNGWLDVLPPTSNPWNQTGAGYIHIGTCAAGATCAGETRLYSEGTITAATDKSFLLGDSVRYGARNLVLAVGGINVGTEAALAQAEADGILPSGLTMNQGVLDRLLRGDTSSGAPALENLVLTARDSVNFYGSVSLSTIDAATGKSSLERLVLGAPALYGYGDHGDIARIETGTLVWNGALTPPASVVAGGAGTGSGRFVVDARQIEFGYGPNSQADTVASHDRLVLGFAGVNLNASERVTANHKGSLSVYQSQGAWDDAAKAWTYSGGDLDISTPLLTGFAGSVNAIEAGGQIHVGKAAGSTAPAADNATLAGALGAEVSLTAGGGLVLDTAVLLPSGKLSLSAEDDVVLADGAQLDLAGRKIDFFDVSKYSWGGEVALDSRSGDIVQRAGSRIDLSARYNRAGKLSAIARQGAVDLGGGILGGSSGRYDAGGTLVPFAAGRVDVRGQSIVDFLGLNTRLSDGGVFGERSFQLGQGDLVIGSEVKAREVNISVDNGHLTVDGTIDASGEQAGSIRLAANHGLTLTGSAVLDTSASVLRKDSYGQVIEAPNRAMIELDSGAGRLTLATGARLDLSLAGAAGNYGTVALNAPRLGGATGNDVDIDASGTVTITGARSIAVNAFHTYDDADPGTDPTVEGRDYQVIDQDYLDRKHLDSQIFIDNALANGQLMTGKLKGLRVYTDAFHLRPGVEIVSSTADGDLHIDGDIDLSGHRYASVNPHTQKSGVHGSGEAGALVLRAAGDLAIFGSISDGFDTSRLGATADDQGWVLPAGRMPFGGDLIIPHGGLVTLDAGTVFKAGRTLNYDLPLPGLTLPSGTVLPVAMPLGQALTLPAGTVLAAAVRDSAGNLVCAAGTVLQQPLALDAGMRLDAGFRLSSEVQLAVTAWPKGVPLPVNVKLAQPLALAKGAIVPSETDVLLPGGASTVNLRPADAGGSQGRTLALAPMLAAGSQSTDLRLVAGADLTAADTRAVNVDGTGALRLADTHFGLGAKALETFQIPLDVDPQFLIDMSYGGFDWQPGELVTPETVQMLRDFGYIAQSPEELNSWGYGNVMEFVSADIEWQPARQQLFSVLRTGTGDLDLIAGGDFAMSSPFGVYTAGTPSASLGAAYDLARGRLADGTVLQREGAQFEGLVDGGADSLYAAWYPEHGGNLLLRAGGDLKGDLIGNHGGRLDTGYVFANTRQQIASTAVGTWLWRQGTGSVVADADAVPTAWWINFGTYVAGDAAGQRDEYGSFLFGNDPFLVGFTGIGTLGGGNLTVAAGGDAGLIDIRGNAQLNGQQQADAVGHTPRSQGLHLAIGSTGRITGDGTLVQTGGGDLDLRLGGTLNPNPQLRRNEHDLNSTFVNLRGALHVDAGAVGGVQLRYGVLNQVDSRTGDPFAAGSVFAGGGPILVLGDSTVRIDTRGDLVLGGVADPGRTLLLNATPFSYQGTAHDGDGWSWFSLWTPATAIDLLSAGGNLTPTTAWAEGGGQEDTRWNGDGRNQSANGDGYFYPSILRAAAANGSLYYGVGSSGLTNNYGGARLRVAFGVTLAPSPQDAQFANVTGKGELQLLASDSIYASGFSITASTADPLALTSPFRPGFSGKVADSGGGPYGWDSIFVHNASAEAAALVEGWLSSDGGRGNSAPLFTFGTGATSAYAAQQQAPARYYAVDGDIVGLRMGQEVLLGFPAGAAGSRYEASIPVAIRAGRDITDSGTPLGRKDTVTGRKTSTADTRGNLIAHAYADDISVVEAGRDIRNSSFYIVGPGLLEVSAGRDLYFADNGELKSLGPIVNVTPGDRGSGASIAVAAGLGSGAHWDDFAARYLDPANQADLERPFADQPGKALYIYGGELTQAQWLRREFGYSGDEAGAEAFLAQKQAELDRAREQALAEGRTAPNRSLQREYKLEGRLHLVNWLNERFAGGNGLGLHFDAATMDARAFFAALPLAQQRAYLRNVYYAELKAAGREYNAVDGKRFGSYLRGREAIATLLPERDAEGNKLAYEGDLTLFSSALYYDADYATNPVGKNRPTPGKTYLTKAEWEALGRPGYNVSFYDVLDAGIHTNFGGDISIMTPGGRTLVGVDGGFSPGAGSGVITQGEGDINIYALDDILMGQSRIFTTFGGNILAWSAQGDINAGRGAKTTIVYTPQRRVYDAMGNVALSPSAPNTGAGIATLNPIPEVPPGDIDLIAPLGTIDAGEAGIRVSGNVNLAALHVVNAENIQVQGKATGIPTVAAVNVGALTDASAAASSAAGAASDMLQRNRANERQNQPSVFTVRVLGAADDSRRVPDDRGAQLHRGAYDRNGVVQVLGTGTLSAAEQQPLTPDERRDLQL